MWIHFQEHIAHLLKEKSSERLHGAIDITPSHLQLFTAADLSSPSHRVPLFTPRVRTAYRCSHHVFALRTAVHTTYRCSHHVCSYRVPLFTPRTAVHTTCLRTRSKYPYEKCFAEEKVSWWNNIRVTNFRTTSAA